MAWSTADWNILWPYHSQAVKGIKAKRATTLCYLANIRATIYWSSLPSIYSSAPQECFPNAVISGNLPSSIPMECLTWVEVRSDAVRYFLLLLLISCIDAYGKTGQPCSFLNSVQPSPLTKKDGVCRVTGPYSVCPKKEKKIYH